MSNWDFGYGREPANPRDPYDEQAASYPLTYERDDSRRPQRPPHPQAGPRHALRPTSPGRAMPPRPEPRQAGTRSASPWQTGPQSAAPRPAPPWAPVPPPADQFDGDQYMFGQPGYPGGQPGYPGGQPGYPGGQRGYAGEDPGFVSAPPGYASGQRGGDPYLGGQPGYIDGDRSYAGGQRGYGDGQRRGGPYQEPWLDDPRGPRLGTPWWDPDSWPGWRRWLIPVGVAVLAALIGAALVLLTSAHPTAPAAIGPAKATTLVRPAAPGLGVSGRGVRDGGIQDGECEVAA